MFFRETRTKKAWPKRELFGAIRACSSTNVPRCMAKIPNCVIDCFSRRGIWRLKPCCFDWKIVCCGKASRCDANGTKLRLEVLVSFFNCYCAPRRTRKTTIPTICGWCAVCGLRARRFRHRTIFPPVFIRWAGPWCMRLGVDGNPRSWWHFNAWFRNGRTRGLGRRNHQGELSLRLRSAQFVLIEFV